MDYAVYGVMLVLKEQRADFSALCFPYRLIDRKNRIFRIIRIIFILIIFSFQPLRAVVKGEKPKTY